MDLDFTHATFTQKTGRCNRGKGPRGGGGSNNALIGGETLRFDVRMWRVLENRLLLACVALTPSIILASAGDNFHAVVAIALHLLAPSSKCRSPAARHAPTPPLKHAVVATSPPPASHLHLLPQLPPSQLPPHHHPLQALAPSGPPPPRS